MIVELGFMIVTINNNMGNEGMNLDFILFCFISFVGWQVFRFIKIPGAAIVGPIFSIAVANIFGVVLEISPLMRPILAIIIGSFLGLSFKASPKGIVKRLVLVCGWLIGSSVITGYVINVAGVERATAMFAALPGGMAELSLVAMSFGADPFLVALIQSTRLILMILVISVLAKRYGTGNQGQEDEKAEYNGEKEEIREVNHTKDWVVIFIIAFTIGFALEYINFNAGSIIGPIITTGLYSNYRKISLKPNNAVRNIAQIGIGGLIGLKVTKASIIAIPSLLPALIIGNVLMIGSFLILSKVLEKITGWDKITCLLSTAPGGFTPISVLAIDLKADVSRVAIFHIIRLIVVVLFAPLQAYLILSFF